MSTEATVQILDSSIDTAGISVVTATRTAEDPRQGMIYNPVSLAAAVPVWFHAMQDGRYIGLFAERWHTATMSASGPQVYSAHTETTAPSMLMFDPSTGSTGAVVEVPSRQPGVRDLTSAASRVDYLFTVGTCDNVAHVQHHRVTVNGDILLESEEIIAPVAGVNFSFGCFVDGEFLVLVGTDADDQVFWARKHWGRVGDSSPDAEWSWQYRSARGWTGDPTEMEPLIDITGVPILTVGPVSVGTISSRTFMAVSTETGVKFYAKRPIDNPWRPVAAPVTCDYLYLQPQLHVQVAVVPDGARTAMPYVRTDYTDLGEGNETLAVGWGVLPVFGV